MTFIGYKTPETFRSRFNPLTGFHESVLSKVNNHINQRIYEFFQTMGINYALTEFVKIPDTITEMEFQKTTTELANSYFYEIIFTDIQKNNNGNIEDSIKYCITFDRDLTPYTKNNFNYGFIKISNRPVLYYILIDLPELIRISKT